MRAPLSVVSAVFSLLLLSSPAASQAPVADPADVGTIADRLVGCVRVAVLAPVEAYCS